MNFFEEYKTITSAISNLNLKSEYMNTGGGDTPYHASNLSNLRSYINSLEKIKYLKDDVDAIKKTWLYTYSGDTRNISGSQKSEVENNLSIIKVKLLVLRDISEDLSFFMRDDLLFIKKPELQSFDELSKFSSDLKKGIELPITNEDIQGKIKIVGADQGSIIFYVAVGTILAIKLIAGICWAAAVIRRKNAEAKIYEEHTRTLELKNDILNTFIEAQKTQLKNILDSEAQAIADKYYPHKDPEAIERLKLSISTVSDLIDKGTKILPMSENDEIQKAFPDYSKLNLIESTIKQITEGQKQ